ncbi:RDD family protein [Candidatus Gracilibacteria bacterium]|nr:MAG: RDD family protein [Candidatus Gracilibacteria bacterium]
MFLSQNQISVKTRLKELFIDYLVILVYLLILLAGSMIFYYFLGEIPKFREFESQMIATFSSVVPIVLMFSYFDYSGGTPGKRCSGLKIYFEKQNFLSSLLRNTVKFTPWQIAHICTIHLVYTEFSLISIIFENIAIILALILFFMGIFRKDKRHLGDFLAKTQVQRK